MMRPLHSSPSRPRAAYDLALRPTTVVVVLTVFAGCLRLATIGSQSYWYDEVFTANAVGGSFRHMSSAVTDLESTPPLYYALLWCWAQVLGTGDATLRVFSALAGTAMVPVAYTFGRSLVSTRVGLTAAALTSVSPVLVWYAQEARAYALFALLGACALASFARALENPSARRPLLLWGLFSALSLSTHYFAIFSITPQAVWLLWRHPHRRRTLEALAPVFVTAVALLPLALHQAGKGHTKWIGGIPLELRAKDLLTAFLWRTAPFPHSGSLVALALGAVAALFVLRCARGTERRGAALAAGLGVATLAVPFALALVGTDYVLARNLILAWLPLAVFLAAGLASRRAGLPGAFIAVALAVFSLALVVATSFRADWRRHDWRSAAAAIPSGGLLVLLGDYPAGQRIAISHYAPDLTALPSTGTRVREIVAVGYAFGSTSEELYRPPNAFHVVERRHLDGEPQLYLTRYQSDRAMLVRPSDVTVLAGEKPQLLIAP